jgi:hypothetical protein
LRWSDIVRNLSVSARTSESQQSTHCARFLHDKGWTAVDPKLPFGSSVGGVLLPRAVRSQPVKLHRTVPIVLLNVAVRNGYLAPVSAQAAKLDRLAVTYDAAPRSAASAATRQGHTGHGQRPIGGPWLSHKEDFA